MKRNFPLPLVIDCDGLSKKLIADLADRLAMHFENVKIEGDDIVAEKPLGFSHYDTAWQILDRFGVKVV